MNIRTRTILTAVAFATATYALGSRAANQDAFFEKQRQITDGYYPQFDVRAKPARTRPAIPHQIAENRWFELERARGSGNVKPVPFPPPPDRAVGPETDTKLARGNWWDEERRLDDGYAWLSPRARAAGPVSARLP